MAVNDTVLAIHNYVLCTGGQGAAVLMYNAFIPGYMECVEKGEWCLYLEPRVRLSFIYKLLVTVR